MRVIERPGISSSPATSEDEMGCCEMCPMCSQDIVEASEDAEGQDAIFCDGADCQVWYHRWCAGVTKSKHELVVLDASEAPFFCPTCVANQQSREIAALQDAVKALTAQLSELQLQRTDERRPSTIQQQPWSVVVRSGNKGRGRGKGRQPPARQQSAPAIPGPQDQPSPVSNPGSGSGSGPSSGPVISQREGPKPPHVQVSGARKIWGTLRSTTTAAVVNTLKALTNIPSNSLTVKRKFKVAVNSPKQVVRWWFVVRGKEQILQQLQDAWGSVHFQTAWKLEPVLEFQKAAADSPMSTQPPPVLPAPHNDLSGQAPHTDLSSHNDASQIEPTSG